MIHIRIDFAVPLPGGDKTFALDAPDADHALAVTARTRPNLVIAIPGRGWWRANLDKVRRLEVWAD